MPLKCRGVVTVKNLLIKPDFMKKFEKLSRDEMKNVKGGSLYPACLTGRTCYTVPNGVCSGSAGITCYCTSTTTGTQSSDPNCSGQTP
jgi:hypothetical protein